MLTVVDNPPTARSEEESSGPQFHVPFFAFDARFAPPVYITSVTASFHLPTFLRAVKFLSTRHPSGRFKVGVLSDHMELKSSLTFEAAGVTPPGDATTPKDDTAVVNTDNIIFLIFIMSN